MRRSFFMIGSFAAVFAATPALANLEGQARPAAPKNHEIWAAQISNNYPVEALLGEMEGSPVVSVIIDKKGRVENCNIVETSGHRILDEAACEGMMLFAEFSPAQGVNGNAAKGVYQMKISYRFAKEELDLSRDAYPINIPKWSQQVANAYPKDAIATDLEGSVDVNVTVNTKGEPVSCQVSVSSGHDVLDQAACDAMVLYAQFLPALDVDGYPVAGSFSTRVTYRR